MPQVQGIVGGGNPQQATQGGQDPFGVAPVVSPGNVQGGDVQKMLQVLEQIMSQAVDPNGYLDMTKLASMWPKAAVDAGLNMPFDVLLQVLQQNPELIQDLVVKLGLSGIILEGQVISGEQLSQMGGGGNVPTPGQASPQGPPQGAGRVA